MYTRTTSGSPGHHNPQTPCGTAVLLSPSPLKERLERAVKAGARPRVDAEVECDASRHVRFSSSNIARRVMARNTPRECWKRRAARALVEPADAAAANVRRYGEEPYAGGHDDPQNDSPSPLVPSLHGRDSLLQRQLIATLQHSAAPHPEERWWSGERSRCLGAMDAGLEKEKGVHMCVYMRKFSDVVVGFGLLAASGVGFSPSKSSARVRDPPLSEIGEGRPTRPRGLGPCPTPLSVCVCGDVYLTLPPCLGVGKGREGVQGKLLSTRH